MSLEGAFLSINNKAKKKNLEKYLDTDREEKIERERKGVDNRIKIYWILVRDSDAATKSTCSPTWAWHTNDAWSYQEESHYAYFIQHRFVWRH